MMKASQSVHTDSSAPRQPQPTDVPDRGEATAGGPVLTAGVGRVDITDYESGPVSAPLYTKALVLRDDHKTAVIASVDAVSLGEIGRIGDDYMVRVRTRLTDDFGIERHHVLVNASHCHGAVCADVHERTVEAVRRALGSMVPVTVGVGRGREDRIMENRRLRLHDGSEADCRRAYSLVPDSAVAAIGPVDPDIGILRLDREDGHPLAVVYTFACHPIQGVPSGANTADVTGFASLVIEENLPAGAMAFFLQGCGADINPLCYKDVSAPPDAESLGNLLGLSTLRAVRAVTTRPIGSFEWTREAIELPRADLSASIAALESEQTRLLQSLSPTNINLKTFLELTVRHSLSSQYPSAYAHRYLHEAAAGRDHLRTLDARNQALLDTYRNNIHAMEALTRIRVNLRLLRMHQARNQAAEKPTVTVELLGVRIGDFVLLTFPGELTVPIGLGIKKRSPHPFTFVAGCTNGYVYYAPTAEQLRNRGRAQEDSDCFLAPAWQACFEKAVDHMLAAL